MKSQPNQWASGEKTFFVHLMGNHKDFQILIALFCVDISAIAKINPLCFCHSKAITRQRGFILINIFVEAGFKDNSGKKLVYLI
ncbi:hypothetical protein [Nostoc sp. DSM 114167]|uniref:hypothetical protein n=1 Tax=Nostoc sp. DSM 114167 TaxID=3439050 RepID=UPI0040456733